MSFVSVFDKVLSVAIRSVSLGFVKFKGGKSRMTSVPSYTLDAVLHASTTISHRFLIFEIAPDIIGCNSLLDFEPKGWLALSA